MMLTEAFNKSTQEEKYVLEGCTVSRRPCEDYVKTQIALKNARRVSMLVDLSRSGKLESILNESAAGLERS